MKKKSMLMAVRFCGLVLIAAFILFISQRASPKDTPTSLVQKDGTENIEVHFIDVGQGDSILIKTKEASMLIDAGENNKGTAVVSYLENQGIKKLDYVIGTHPHSDHIGGLDYVINSIPVDQVILPEAVHTTKTYEDVLDAMEAHGLKATKPVVGDKYSLGPASFIILSPNSSSYDELNNYSVGIRLTYNQISFLLAGDAEKLSEEEMLKNGLNLSADVLKLSHHGSGYSSCEDFLDAVNPDYAVICVGKDNEYGHPDPKTLRALVKHKIKVYRTDAQQTVIFTTDGKTISTNKEPYVVTENDLKADTN